LQFDDEKSVHPVSISCVTTLKNRFCWLIFFLISCKKEDMAIKIDTGTAGGSNTGQNLPPLTSLMKEPMSTQVVRFPFSQ
jgi:hypothetical protein